MAFLFVARCHFKGNAENRNMADRTRDVPNCAELCVAARLSALHPRVSKIALLKHQVSASVTFLYQIPSSATYTVRVCRGEFVTWVKHSSILRKYVCVPISSNSCRLSAACAYGEYCLRRGRALGTAVLICVNFNSRSRTIPVNSVHA